MLNKTSLCIISAVLLAITSGCSHHQYPIAIGHNSTDGTPVATRMSASDSGFRFFGLGSSPSMKRAVDKLYAGASMSGYRINGNNYAFQNIIAENKSTFLYPVIGTSTLTVCADLYAYEYGTPEQEKTDEQ